MPDSTFLRHIPCPSCGSSDANSLYTDGHTHCFACNTTSSRPAEALETTEPAPATLTMHSLLSGEARAIPSRQLTAETCEKWRYYITRYKDQDAQAACYCDDAGRVVAQKVRLAGKRFSWLGSPKECRLFGQHLWRDGGKMLTITEGEIDALSVSQLWQHKWPVVSVPNGASAAKKDLAQQLEWLEKFESVVFLFDNDEAGQKAVEECVSLLSPGKAKVATLPLKDANDMLKAGRGPEVINAIWGAKVWRPDEIVAGVDLWEVITTPSPNRSVPYPFPGLTRLTHGLRRGEIVTLAAGSGIGKSSICRELAHWLLGPLGETIGYIALEESIKITAEGILSVELCKRLHLTPEEDKAKLREAFDKTIGSGRYYSYDHFGSMEADNLLQRIRYLVTSCRCGWIVLDHLSIVVSGMEGDDERRLIDNLMTRLRSLVEELGFGLLLVSHLKEAPGGPSLEEGGQTSLNLLRGSRAIGQLSDMVLGFERNQQDPETRHLTTVRILKNRFSGETGEACVLSYDGKTGRLTEENSAEFVQASPTSTAQDF